ncbi:PREDICTED: leucine-rich repeat-containing protein 32-like [Tauraco erythrolophus]|uniref:leucine-rich repeat-containing protein 32-like n=1 Tax=Tauraco erythrolophus TaxID=121530 RepID=UPI000523DECC|nr:PREDICTED: leucine-rich repeat-containing protein 32-like [Tauraco erythrolophus]
MLLFEHRLAERGCLLLCLLPAVLRAQSNGEAKPRSTPCQQSSTKVSCKGVGLRKLPKELGQGIKYLELSNNFIQNLSASYMPEFGQLEYLDMCFNQLEAMSDTTLAQLPQLRSLLVGSNHLDRNYLANGQALHLLGNLEVLDLSANNLESHMAGWYISNLTRLRTLDLSGNKMTRLVAGIFWSTPRLRELDLSNNYIMEIEEGAFEALEELEVVNLALNSLHCISGFSLTQLQVLNLSHNALELFGWEEGAEPYLLQVLDLSHNRLLSFPELPRAHYLTHLNLSNNLIASLLPGSPHPEELVLRYEDMVRFNRTSRTAAGLARVADLDLSNNRLQLFPFSFFHSLGSLRSLSLARNCLQDHLSLCKNNITKLQPYAFSQTSLLSLDLSGNEDLFVPKEALVGLEFSLQKLSLRGNQMGDGKAELPCLNALKVLDLSGNNLSLLPTGLSCSPLESLDVRDNNLPTLEKPALASWTRSLKDVSVAGNPFGCCSLGWLDALRAAGVGMPDLDEAICAYRDGSRNFSAKITSSPRWLCPRPEGTGSLALLVVLMSLFFLSSGACCLLKKGQKSPGCAGLHSNRVGVFPPEPKREEPTEARPADTQV